MSDQPAPPTCFETNNMIRITELEKRFTDYQEYQRETDKLISDSITSRMEHSNNLIAHMKEQQHLWVPRGEIYTKIESLHERIGVLKDQVSAFRGWEVRVGTVAAALGALAGFMMAFIARKFGG